MTSMRIYVRGHCCCVPGESGRAGAGAVRAARGAADDGPAARGRLASAWQPHRDAERLRQADAAQQKKYVASILSGPRSDISGPLGVDDGDPGAR